MKHKKKLIRLQKRIKAYEQTIATNKNNTQGFKKPGSLNKS